MFKRKYNSSALNLLERHNQMLANECSKRVELLKSAFLMLKDDCSDKIAYEASFILSVTEGRKALHNAISDLKKNQLPDIYTNMFRIGKKLN